MPIWENHRGVILETKDGFNEPVYDLFLKGEDGNLAWMKTLDRHWEDFIHSIKNPTVVPDSVVGEERVASVEVGGEQVLV